MDTKQLAHKLAEWLDAQQNFDSVEVQYGKFKSVMTGKTVWEVLGTSPTGEEFSITVSGI